MSLLFSVIDVCPFFSPHSYSRFAMHCLQQGVGKIAVRASIFRGVYGPLGLHIEAVSLESGANFSYTRYIAAPQSCASWER